MARVVTGGSVVVVARREALRRLPYFVRFGSAADVFVYPGSGATTDTQLLKAQRAAQQVAPVASAAADGDTGAAAQPAGAPEHTVMNGIKTEEGAAGGSAAHSSGLVSVPASLRATGFGVVHVSATVVALSPGLNQRLLARQEATWSSGAGPMMKLRPCSGRLALDG